MWPSVATLDPSVGGSIWLVLAVVVIAAKAGGEIALRLGQPAVLGELLVGVLLGNLDAMGLTAFERQASGPELALLADLGVVLLLFKAGLDSSIAQMRAVAGQSSLVAVVGVAAPMTLGAVTIWWLMPETTMAHHLFVGAALAATSIGITARVLDELGASGGRESRIILGAAVLDDVLGLIALAVVAALAVNGGDLGWARVLGLVGWTVGVLVLALVIGSRVTPGLFRLASRLRAEGVLVAGTLATCFLFAGLSEAAGLAAIVGAFAAGLLLEDVHVRPFGRESVHELSELVSPIVGVFAPVFFVRTGMSLDLSVLSPRAAAVALALTIAAVIGKLLAGLAASDGVDRMTIGIGMLPRGEVGLIFADTGARLLENGHPVFDGLTYAAVVLMVLATTMLTPPWLAQRLRRLRGAASRSRLQ